MALLKPNKLTTASWIMLTDRHVYTSIASYRINEKGRRGLNNIGDNPNRVENIVKLSLGMFRWTECLFGYLGLCDFFQDTTPQNIQFIW